ncbi:ATP-binding protein [Cocleimonas sp. KMM 6892]|uniref:sensor histidine kinase n=2 Tax=Cocleimonas TaxID=998014 RepID=UPI002DBBE677|nr:MULTISPECIES: ATP-binding protein [unclassified Cocleimonas]MEB8430860.1 ATP-binding protein [Cocleimonas sp. KMM 6892]MEC4714368.1 ATP-binding protein [Cocleimonas sp. KMM 6895]
MLILFGIILASLALMTAYSYAKKSAETELQTTLQRQLLLIVNKLQITLGRHLYLPSLLSNNNEIIDFLKTTESTEAFKRGQESINLSLEHINNISGTTTIFLMNSVGKVVSSSNWADKNSLIDKDYSDWPYFAQAKHNILGRYFTSQTENNERYYFFARSIQVNKKVIGIVVVQVPLSDLAFNWTAANVDFVVTDNNGIIFLSSKSEWDLNAISDVDLSVVKRNKRYQYKKDIKTLNKESFDLKDEGFQIVKLLDKKYQMLTKNMDMAGWDVRVLSDYSIAEKAISRKMLISAILILLVTALAGLLMKIQNQRKDFQQRATEELENKVAERTQALKKSQEDLIQAAKMAALGELSTGITHEINNPLSAIRAYADNASQFLQKDRLDMVGQNLTEITKLTENMAAITGQLKSFARKSKGQLKPVNIDASIDRAIAIVNSKIVSSGTNINYKINTHDPKKMVLADEVWLSQILVNLISNAISATSEKSERNVWIDVTEKGSADKVLKDNDEACNHEYCIEISDNGTGIEESNLSRIFEPFFTTKHTSKGLGLGLSISFNLVKDMNGSLDARNRKGGGALFTLCLPAVDTQTESDF